MRLILLGLPLLLFATGCPHEESAAGRAALADGFTKDLAGDNKLRIACGLEPIDSNWGPIEAFDFEAHATRKDGLVRKRLGSLGPEAATGLGESEEWWFQKERGEELRTPLIYSLTAVDASHVQFHLIADESGRFTKLFPEYNDGVRLTFAQATVAKKRLKAFAARLPWQ